MVDYYLTSKLDIPMQITPEDICKILKQLIEDVQSNFQEFINFRFNQAEVTLDTIEETHDPNDIEKIKEELTSYCNSLQNNLNTNCNKIVEDTLARIDVEFKKLHQAYFTELDKMNKDAAVQFKSTLRELSKKWELFE